MNGKMVGMNDQSASLARETANLAPALPAAGSGSPEAGGPSRPFGDDPIANKTVLFCQFDQPALECGNYVLTLDQGVSVTPPAASSVGDADPAPGKQAELYRSERKISVLGSRFSLPASSVAGFFPPANGSGDYDNVLPHASFSESTLPWQRFALEGDRKTPWLALLLFGDGVKAPDIVAGTLGDLQWQDPKQPHKTGNPLPASTVSYGGGAPFEHESDESLDDPCRFVDIAAADFLALAPSFAELSFLAHTRVVALAPSGRGEEPDEAPGVYATLCSNRFVSTQTAAWTAMVVSLEKMSAYLPADDTYEPDAKAWSGFGAIRLAVLTSWSFASQTPKETFIGYLEGLQGLGGLAPLAPPAPTDDGSAAAAYLASVGSAGFCLLPHQTRLGPQTASLYRGPLLPYAPPALAAKDVALQEGADACVRYDPKHGVMDMSLSCAWQLGRLAALQDLDFSRSLQAWKRQQATGAYMARWGRELAERLVPAALAEPAGASSAADGADGGDALAAPPLAGRAAIEQAAPLALKAAFAAIFGGSQ
jgi:hypothetical protein